MLKKINKILILIKIFLIIGIISKINVNYREKIHYYLYEDNFAYSEFRNIYNKYLGDYFPLNHIDNNTKEVFSEKIKYSEINKYLDGYKLKVEKNYLVPAISSGIITYIGEKENYGNVIIIMGEDGVNIWYGNIQNSTYKLYDSIEKGTYLGEVNEYLYLVFLKEKQYLNYEEYLQ